MRAGGLGPSRCASCWLDRNLINFQGTEFLDASDDPRSQGVRRLSFNGIHKCRIRPPPTQAAIGLLRLKFGKRAAAPAKMKA